MEFLRVVEEELRGLAGEARRRHPVVQEAAERQDRESEAVLGACCAPSLLVLLGVISNQNIGFLGGFRNKQGNRKTKRQLKNPDLNQCYVFLRENVFLNRPTATPKVKNMPTLGRF